VPHTAKLTLEPDEDSGGYMTMTQRLDEGMPEGNFWVRFYWSKMLPMCNDCPDGTTASAYWLRSGGNAAGRLAAVSATGTWYWSTAFQTGSSYTVRPAIWVRR